MKSSLRPAYILKTNSSDILIENNFFVECRFESLGTSFNSIDGTGPSNSSLRTPHLPDRQLQLLHKTSNLQLNSMFEAVLWDSIKNKFTLLFYIKLLKTFLHNLFLYKTFSVLYCGHQNKNGKRLLPMNCVERDKISFKEEQVKKTKPTSWLCN